MVAAAGVVNQADEQRILLPGYFTTPGLHHTHPLQGASWDQRSDWGRGGVGSLCERVSSSSTGELPKMLTWPIHPPPPGSIEAPARAREPAFVGVAP